MLKDEFNKKVKSGEVTFSKEKKPSEEKATNNSNKFDDSKIEDYVALFQKLRVTKRHLTSAPTFTPKDFYESIQFYDTGGVRRLYLFINGSWRYVALT